MRLLILSLIAVILPLTQSHAGEIDLVADVVQFRVDENRVQWEFHYAFPDTALRYVPSNGAFLGEIYFNLTLANSLGDTIRQEWIASTPATSATPAHERFLSGIRSLIINAGQYTVRLRAFDLNDTTSGATSTFTTVVNPFPSDVSVSEMMFTLPGTDVIAGMDQRFIRNGQAAMPNPRHEYVGTDPWISIYAEVYNAKSKGLGSYTVVYDVLDNARRDVMSVEFERQGLADALVERAEFPLDTLPSGVYYLRMSIRSADGKTYAMREDRFFLMNPDRPPVQQTLLTEDERFERSEWATHRGERLGLELELSDVLASSAEKTTRAGCTTERAKQKYLFGFWNARDPKPETEVNERLEEFRVCYNRAQSYYASPAFPNGWKSDRGKILLKYGIPTQVEQYFQTTDKRAYEAWLFRNLQGGSYFYFVDRWADGNHRLVHSTLFGEIRDEKWMERYVDIFVNDPDRSRKSRDDIR
jgi:GWxTD domain-containing protein